MDDDAYTWMCAAWEELQVCGQDQDRDVICIAKDFYIVGIFLDEDGVLTFDYNDEQEMISEFLHAYDAADKTSKSAVSTLIENALQETGCFSVSSAIVDAAFKRNWSTKLDKAFLSDFAPVETKTTEAEKGTSKESDKNNIKPKKVKKQIRILWTRVRVVQIAHLPLLLDVRQHTWQLRVGQLIEICQRPKS